MFVLNNIENIQQDFLVSWSVEETNCVQFSNDVPDSCY